jgi:hypothetical protein
MNENIFFQCLTKENLISIIDFFPLDILMNFAENNHPFKQNISFMYGNKEAFPPVDKKNYYNFEKKLNKRWPSYIDRTMIMINIETLDDLKIFYVDLIIKNIFPMNLFIRSPHSLENLKRKNNFDSFLNDHYSKEELALFFEKLPFFNIHPEIHLTHLQKTNITGIDHKKVFIINFENNNLKHR